MKIIMPPVTMPISLSEAKLHLRLEMAFTADDNYVMSLIGTAISYVESYCNRRLISQTWESVFESWEDVEKHFIPGGQLQGVVNISYYDEDSTNHIVSANDYIVTGIATDEGKVEFVDDADLSSDLYQVNPIRVRYTCGYYQGVIWVAETAYLTGDQVLARYGLVAQFVSSEIGGDGTSHTSEPLWPATIGETVVDGDISWEIIGRSVPDTIKQALLLLVTQYYENREPVVSDAAKDSISNILLPHRIWNFKE